MAGENRVRVRLFGFLHTFRMSRGLPDTLEVEVPPEGRTGYDIATEQSLPVERIEAVFRNGRVQNLHDPVFPGDRVAFVPHGTPGPHRVLLGLYGDSLDRARREKERAAGEH